MEYDKVSVINKSMEVIHEDNNIDDCDMDLINKYTRRKLEKDDVYVFSVVLCDNDVDRQNESFSDESLNKLSELFIGKTGIMDHNVVSANQTARIFSCEVREILGRFTSVGKQYKQLTAKAYMPRTKSNEEFIALIDSGIKKEVSINCAVSKTICSICGSNAKKEYCEHEKGKEYIKNGKSETCYYILDDPVDAYEWSFVVVPAQREAGVIKSFIPGFNGGEYKMEDIIKKLSLGEKINLNESDSTKLYGLIEELKEKASIGEEYFKELKSEVLRLSSITQPEIEIDIMKGIIEKMSIKELKSFKDAYKKKALRKNPIKPQLSYNQGKSTLNTQFKI